MHEKTQIGHYFAVCSIVAYTFWQRSLLKLSLLLSSVKCLKLEDSVAAATAANVVDTL
jgi:hypothetical protein